MRHVPLRVPLRGMLVQGYVSRLLRAPGLDFLATLCWTTSTGTSRQGRPPSALPSVSPSAMRPTVRWRRYSSGSTRTPTTIRSSGRSSERPSAASTPTTAQLLLDWGADVNYSADGVSPLLKFLSHDRENIACDWCDRQKPYDSAWADPFLDSEDVDIHVKTTRGESPLWVAAAEGYADDCKRLVEKGGNPLDVDHAGRTALRQACLLDSEPLRWRIVSILLSTGIGRDLVHETFDEDTSVLGGRLRQNRQQDLRAVAPCRSDPSRQPATHGGPGSERSLLLHRSGQGEDGRVPKAR